MSSTLATFICHHLSALLERHADFPRTRWMSRRPALSRALATRRPDQLPDAEFASGGRCRLAVPSFGAGHPPSMFRLPQPSLVRLSAFASREGDRGCGAPGKGRSVPPPGSVTSVRIDPSPHARLG